MEEFRDIKGYEGIYQVSNLGRVKSLKRKGVPSDRILIPGLVGNKRNYEAVKLWKDGSGKTHRVHQLVFHTFEEELKGYDFVVDHFDKNTRNNNLSNLRKLSNRENSMRNRKGCHYDKSRKKWKSEIYLNGKRTYLGRFDSEIEAVNAYKNKLREYEEI